MAAHQCSENYDNCTCTSYGSRQHVPEDYNSIISIKATVSQPRIDTVLLEETQY